MVSRQGGASHAVADQIVDHGAEVRNGQSNADHGLLVRYAGDFELGLVESSGVVAPLGRRRGVDPRQRVDTLSSEQRVNRVQDRARSANTSRPGDDDRAKAHLGHFPWPIERLTEQWLGSGEPERDFEHAA